MIVVEHSTQPRAALEGGSPVRDQLFRYDQPIAQTLVVALVMVNRPIFPHFSGRWRRPSCEGTAILTSSAPAVNEKPRPDC